MTICEICKKNEGPITCTDIDCGTNLCVPCIKVYNEAGEINPKTTDSLVFLCPKCNQPISIT